MDDAALAQGWVRRAPEDLTGAAAVASFDRQEPVAVAALNGRWRGVELPPHPVAPTLAPTSSAGSPTTSWSG